MWERIGVVAGIIGAWCVGHKVSTWILEKILDEHEPLDMLYLNFLRSNNGPYYSAFIFSLVTLYMSDFIKPTLCK